MKNHDLKKLYKDSNILIFPSVFDGWGVVPMEAMANKMFLIISKNCGVREVINKSENIVLPSVNTVDIEKSIIYCLKNKKKISIQGSKNYLIIKNSKCNLDKSIKVIKKELR